MKIGHFSLWAPHRSGLFQAVVDQIKYENKAGLNSIFINSDVENPDPNRFKYQQSDGVEIVAKPWQEAYDCDVIVLHRSIPVKLSSLIQKKKSVAILHGTSEIMVLHDIEEHGREKRFKTHVDFMNMYKKVVTITKSDTHIMKQYEIGNRSNKIVYINDAIDTELYSPNGQTWDYVYRPAIISCCNIRINKNPAPLVWSIDDICKKIPTARLNFFGINLAEIMSWRDMVLLSGVISNKIENFHNQFFDLKPFMRGADIAFNSNYNGVFSRDSMESCAVGCSVIAYTPEHSQYPVYRCAESITDGIVKAWNDILENPERQLERNRQYALDNFSMEKAVQKYIDVYNSI